MDSVERKALLSSVFSLTVLAVLALATYAGTSDFIGRTRELNRIHQVLGKLDLVFKQLAIARADQERFMLSGKRGDLDACQDALFAIDGLAGEIRQLSMQQALQIRRLQQLEPLLADQINRVNSAIRRRQGRQRLANAKDSMGGVERLLSEFKAHETELMARQSSTFEHEALAIKWLLAGSVAMNLLVFAFVHWLIHREMSRRREAEAGQQRQSRVLASVLRDMGDAILVYDGDGRLNASNPAAERLFGPPQPRLAPEAFAQDHALLQEDRSQPIPYQDLPIVRALAGEDIDNQVLCVRRPADHRLFVLSATARAFHGHDGRISGAMVAYHDITELKSEELALHGAKQGLEERVNALKEAQEALRNVAIRDPLTGQFNRRQLASTFEEELARAAHAGIALGVVMCDIDHFKKVNDGFGHEAGDQVLQAVSAAIHASLRANDSLFRFGGEEFTLLLPGADLSESHRVAEKARQAVGQLALEHAGRPLGRLSISLGVASFPATGRGPQELLRQADEALYASKQAGRDRCTVWTEGMQHAA